MGLRARLDAYQREHRVAGFAFAVVQKFGEDQAGNLAALIAYYTFLSIFPLLLALTTILGYALAGQPGLRHALLGSAVSQLPIIGQDAVGPLTGNAFALTVGLVLAVWSGLAVAQTAQTAFNTVYAVNRTDWPGFVPRLLRSLELVVVGGSGWSPQPCCRVWSPAPMPTDYISASPARPWPARSESRPTSRCSTTCFAA